MLAHPVHSILIGNCQNQPFYCGQFVVYALLPTDDKTVNYQLSVLWFCLEFAAFPSHPLGEFASCTAGDKKFSQQLIWRWERYLLVSSGMHGARGWFSQDLATGPTSQMLPDAAHWIPTKCHLANLESLMSEIIINEPIETQPRPWIKNDPWPGLCFYTCVW